MRHADIVTIQIVGDWMHICCTSLAEDGQRHYDTVKRPLDAMRQDPEHIGQVIHANLRKTADRADRSIADNS